MTTFDGWARHGFRAADSGIRDPSNSAGSDQPCAVISGELATRSWPGLAGPRRRSRHAAMVFATHMQRFAPGLTILLSLALTACGASINEAAKADIDRRASALGPSSREIEAPTAPEPMALAPGQWMTLLQNDGEKRSFATYKIIGQDADAYWIEVSSETYYGKSATRMLVAFGDRTDPRSFDIRSVFTKDTDGRIQEVPAPILSLMRSTYAGILDSFVITWSELPREDAAVPAGRFAGCFKGRSTVSFAGNSVTSDVWWHSAVPINGMVKSVGVDNEGTAELVDFGLTGARSEF
jgi:hypothetical protein